MPAPRRERGAVGREISLARQHPARGKAHLPPAIAPEPDQIRRGLDPGKGLRELLLPVGVSVEQPKKIRACESGLLSGDGIQRQRRAGDDPRAIGAGDFAMHHGGAGILPDFSHASSARDRADFLLRDQCHALRGEAAVIDADIVATLGKLGIGQRCPPLPPAGEQCGIVPFPCFLPKAALGADTAERQQNMGMELRPPVAAACEMHGKISDHPQTNAFRPREIPRHLDVCLKREFPRKGDFDLARHLRVVPTLPHRHRIP